jgi:hypothetical protein
MKPATARKIPKTTRYTPEIMLLEPNKSEDSESP